jgi:hypothetical protein
MHGEGKKIMVKRFANPLGNILGCGRHYKIQENNYSQVLPLFHIVPLLAFDCLFLGLDYL